MQSGDQLTIDTPEQIALELPLAGIGSRFLALAFDTLLQIIMFVVAGLGVGVLAPAMRRLGSLPASFIPTIFILFAFTLYWGYFALFEIFMNGQTPGKRHAGIRVIKDTGRPLTVFECIARNLMRAIDGLPAMYGVGIICMMLNKQHRRLGDYVAGSVVIHDKATAEVRPSWSPAADASVEAAVATPATEVNLADISGEELVLIETYLHRRFELDPAVRTSTAARIANLIQQKTKLELPPGQSADEFLERVVRGIRNSARFR
ncbi:MAG: RDD family protein [Terriglobales bacterium]